MWVVFGVTLLIFILIGVRSNQKKQRTGESRAMYEATAKLLPAPVDPPEALGGLLTAALEGLPGYPGAHAYERVRRFLLDGDRYKLFSIWSYAATTGAVFDEYERLLGEHGWERQSEVERVRVYRKGEWWLTVTPQTAWQADLVLWEEPAGQVPTVTTGAVYRTWRHVWLAAGTAGSLSLTLASQLYFHIYGADQVGWSVLLILLCVVCPFLLVLSLQLARQVAAGRPIAYFPPGSPIWGRGQPAPHSAQPLVLPGLTKAFEALAAAAVLAVFVTALSIWLKPDRALAEPFTFSTIRSTWHISSAHDVPLSPFVTGVVTYIGITVAQWVQVARARGDARFSAVVLHPSLSCVKAGLAVYSAAILWDLMSVSQGGSGAGLWPNLVLFAGLGGSVFLVRRRV